ncbi:MAG: hypothetical protein AB7O98_06555 [Hyphomonadaceae bacterium]
MRAFVFILVASMLAACGQAQQQAAYPPEYEVNFMRACQAQPEAADGRCACIWDAIEANVSPQDFAALERMTPAQREIDPLSRQIEAYALSCIPGGTEGPAPR